MQTPSPGVPTGVTPLPVQTPSPGGPAGVTVVVLTVVVTGRPLAPVDMGGLGASVRSLSGGVGPAAGETVVWLPVGAGLGGATPGVVFGASVLSFITPGGGGASVSYTNGSVTTTPGGGLGASVLSFMTPGGGGASVSYTNGSVTTTPGGGFGASVLSLITPGGGGASVSGNSGGSVSSHDCTSTALDNSRPANK